MSYMEMTSWSVTVGSAYSVIFSKKREGTLKQNDEDSHMCECHSASHRN